MDANAHRAIDQAVDLLLDRIADEIATDAKRMAPVKTGHLRDSIHAEVAHDGTVHIVATADYAAYAELGTSQHAAQPFLRPALLRRRSGR